MTAGSFIRDQAVFKFASGRSDVSRHDDELGQRLEALRGPLVRYFARSVRDNGEIDDLVQEVSLRVVRRGGVEDFANFAGYVFQTADSVLKDRHRRRSVRLADSHDQFDPEQHVVAVEGADRALIARDELRRTSAVLASMPERTRIVFVLRRLERMPFSEIAVRLGISLSAAEKHMQRATRQIIAECGSAVS